MITFPLEKPYESNSNINHEPQDSTIIESEGPQE